MYPAVDALNQMPNDEIMTLLVGRTSAQSPPGRGNEGASPDARSEYRRILWIDDEIARFSAEVLFLRLKGFQVDCAETGAGALAMAITGRYEGILLDLRLPDMPGLAVLAHLRAKGIDTPVLIVTGTGDFKAALVAGQLGASAFESKPLYIEELEAAVERLVGISRADHAGPYGAEKATRGLLNPSYESLATLLEAIHHLARSGGYVEAIRRALSAALIRALVDPALPMRVFLASAKALKRTMSAAPTDLASGLVDDGETIILETLARPAPSDPRVVTALKQVGSAAADVQRLRIETIAKTIGIDPAHLGRLIKEQTGFEFTAWTTAYLLRPGLRPLLETGEDVKQIGCRLLGFKHLSQFDREFDGFFGLTPTDFRGGLSDPLSLESGRPRRNR